MLLNGTPGEFGPVFRLFPVGDEAEDVRVFAGEAVLGGSLGCQHNGK